MVALASTFDYDRQQKASVQVPYPAVAQVYNSHMGGVNLLDSLLANAWLLYRRCHSGEETLKLAEFRVELAVTLCKLGCSTDSNRGRPSIVLIENQRSLMQQLCLQKKFAVIICVIFRSGILHTYDVNC
ncbi:hypothetical protein QE152_g22268 [Popillia japonica]|uniref:Uncharacterized protein n=1 Tax=Popillia japonica TaxID=7064 RepID=A0AAW1KKU9_POPJA